MSITPPQLVLSRLRERGYEPRSSGKAWSCRCPAHEDRNASLSIGIGDDGRALVTCHAKCTFESIITALGLEVRDTFPEPGQTLSEPASPPRPSSAVQVFPTADAALEFLARRRGPPASTWHYHDANSDLVGVVCRWNRADGGKDIRPVARQPDGSWSLAGIPEPRPLYGLPQVLASAGVVYVTEGEKAADALRSIGLTVTTSAHGSKSARQTDWATLAGRHVVIVPDYDDAGEQYASDVAELVGAAGASSVVIARLTDVWPGMPVGGDAADWIEHHDATSTEDFRGMIESLVAHAEPVAMPSPVLPVGDTQPTDEVPWQPFPIDLLPEPLASFVSQTWECLGKQADPVCVALPLLTSVAAAVGHVRRIEIRPGWIEAPVLWGAVVAESGSKKSPSTKAAIRFIQQRHNFTMAEHKRAMAEWEQLREEYVAAKRSKSRGNVETLPPKPTLIQFLVDTVTVEGLAPILECRPSVLLSKDELSGWVASFDRYAANKGADVSQFLSCYDAAAWTINRKTSAPIHIDSAAVSIYGGIQPKVLAKSFGPHVDNGLLPRFMLVEPPEGEPEWPSGEVDFVVNGSLESIFDVLIALQLEDGGLPTVLDFTTDASEIFQRKWWKPINAERRRATGAVRSMLSKAEAWAARLALVIHVCRQAGSEGTLPHRIDAESIERGIGLAHWFSREWQRCFNRFQNGGCDADEAAIAFIQRRGGTITIRDLARLGPPAYRAPGAAEAAILRLVKSGKTEWVKEPTGGRPAEAVRLK